MANRLTIVNLPDCSKVTDAGVSVLAEKCSGLTSVNLEGCKKVVDAVGAVCVDAV